MKNLGSIVAACLLTAPVYAQNFPDFRGDVPPDWSGSTFKLSQSYPAVLVSDVAPWKAFNFKSAPSDYLYAVLTYALEGNLEVDWQVHDNKVRKWYHVPWMTADAYGREFIRGMTRERNGHLDEIVGDPSNKTLGQSWAVGFYNSPGGYTIGQVWKDPNDPTPSAAQFPEGTVTAKLLFTTFTNTQLPSIGGALSWKAAIHKAISCGRNSTDTGPCVRTIGDLRLLQLDVAVKDKDAGKTGWVFGTFRYNAFATPTKALPPWVPADSPFRRMMPVGLMWGNDPTLVPGGTPMETRALATGLPEHLGCAGRLNGPIDNPISSCLSCHMTAQEPPPRPLTPSKCDGSAETLRYFRNLAGNEPFMTGGIALDYSLQLSMGIAAFRNAHPQTNLEIFKGATSLPPVSRGQ